MLKKACAIFFFILPLYCFSEDLIDTDFLRNNITEVEILIIHSNAVEMANLYKTIGNSYSFEYLTELFRKRFTYLVGTEWEFRGAKDVYAEYAFKSPTLGKLILLKISVFLQFYVQQERLLNDPASFSLVVNQHQRLINSYDRYDDEPFYRDAVAFFSLIKNDYRGLF